MSRSAIAAEAGSLENGHFPYNFSHMPGRPSYSSSTSSLPHMHSSRTGSQWSNFSQPNRSSNSTQDTSISTLNAHPLRTSTPAQSHSTVNASNNVINRVADKETSLFQICINLRNRLKGVPGFEEELLEVEQADGAEAMERDPVSILWNTFRRGYPLMAIYNALQPPVLLSVDEAKVPEARRQKIAAFKFLQACVNELKFPTDECFIITDLYGEDTSGFVKVAKVVNRVADILVHQGLLETLDVSDSSSSMTAGSAKRTHREHIVDELVRTERTYVQHLEVLQSFKKLVEQRGIISGDAIHDMFLNLNALLDFQRRFLIRVEQINNTPDAHQNWGALFKYFGNAFRVYEPYIANQRKCEETVMREYDKLRQAGGSVEMRQLVESPTHLTAFLLKPFQRLSKYPLLLKELRDKGDLDQERQDDISEGMETIAAVLDRTNEFIDKEDRMVAVRHLRESVEDWKNHAFEGFGELLLHGTYTVIKGDVTQSEKELKYQMYLFEKILLCCKEANLNKQKNRLMNKSAQLTDKRGRPKLILKGRIFMQNVTETVFLAKPGSYTCQIFWRGDEAIEYFIIRFSTEETMKKWAQAIEIQRRICKENAVQSQPQSTSKTEFNWTRDQGQLQNPYADDGYLEGADLDDPATYGYPDYADYPASRNGSNSSLRSRSTTGESGPPPVQPQPRGASLKQPPIGMVGPALTLRTQLQNAGISPGERGGASYFSPGAESPISSRTSSSSFNMGFGRGMQAPPPGWQNDEHNRFTAPALGRTTSKDVTDPRSGKLINGQPPTHPAALSQTRMRSVSSPDVHANNAAIAARRADKAAPPPVPNLPPHLANNPAALDRSQNNSPNYPNHIPPRVTSQSPTAKRQVSMQQANHQPQYSLDGTASIMSGEMPSQIKVKVKVPSEGSTMTLVVGLNITFQSLKDRIDAKLQRHTNLSLAAGSVKLKYLDDDDYVIIQTDEDVQTAFETWREQQEDNVSPNQMEEIDLYCLR